MSSVCGPASQWAAGGRRAIFAAGRGCGCQVGRRRHEKLRHVAALSSARLCRGGCHGCLPAVGKRAVRAANTGRSGLQNRRFRMIIWAVLPPGAQGADCQMVGLGVWVGLCRGRMPSVTTAAGAACGGGQTAHGYMAIPPSGKHSGRRDCLSARHVAAVPCRLGSLIASRPSVRV